jgi:LmbE family N-acetylglucosaminyl deacetylase
MDKKVLAVVAHPDDIEFLMCGTIILLKRAGFECHFLNIANGSCGTTTYSKEDIIRIRREEAMTSAAMIDAVYHESLVDDLDIFYNKPLLARVAATFREVAPAILLVQPYSDYMEDHQNAARLAVTAAFARSMPNFNTDPLIEPVMSDVCVYHGQPHSNLDPMMNSVLPKMYVDITNVIEQKTQMLACHKSQDAWLDESQKMTSFLESMRTISRNTGRLSGKYEYAEGWSRHLHFGFCAPDADPLADALSEYIHFAPASS